MSANLISLVPGTRDRNTFLSEEFQLSILGRHLELDERYVRSVVDRSGMGQAESAGERGSKEAMATAETC